MSTMGPADELHVAVEAQDVARVQQLLEAAADPATLAAAQDAQGRHALHGLAIVPSTEDDLDDMMDLLGLGGYRQPQDERPSAQQDPSHLLKSLGRPRFDMRQFMAEVVVRYPLTPAQWQLIPSLCPSLAAVLPTVLRRSEAEAALLVARLPDIKRRRLRIGVLCLHHMQAEAGVVLPQPLVWRTLTDSLAH
ncbi:hypothetical protein C2E21_7900 [Chlorella sorokiniana]|uniref:Uncharacterized protein n=1 Tax=Chlorella sorokiniana TaxID=3076 RepID=A0A2P6TGL3_CHLSO|nr:hypothetical protein C2E21_7900 [Chlorella sorokiniana]|eukprot:PRW33268.1 hypothetical protein C2E21_7900 [Chlorella sorokiniana]